MRNLKPALGNAALLLLGVGIALILMELLLRTFPNWIPSEVRVNPPVRRARAFLDETYDVKLSNGDLFYWMQGKIMPLLPDQDKEVAHVRLTTDAHGFRNTLPEKATYSIVALGDSFTRASSVANPWTEMLAEYTGSDVLNLGDVGFGPQDELDVLQQYGLKKKPQWVVMAFFEGNDLYDAAAYELANPFILTRFGGYLFVQGRDAWLEKTSGRAYAEVASDYQYPVTVTINGTSLEMAFFPYYISWLSVDREAIQASQNYRIVRETILHMQELSEAAEARLLLVYVPSKIHVYLPYLNDGEILKRIFTGVPALELDEAGFLEFTNQSATLELTRQHMNDQAKVLADFAEEQNILFLDLTPYFQEEARAGAELYYPFDTHWNQHGHNLAAQTIANYMEDIKTVTAGKETGE